jgi:hypothetical protein
VWLRWCNIYIWFQSSGPGWMLLKPLWFSKRQLCLVHLLFQYSIFYLGSWHRGPKSLEITWVIRMSIVQIKWLQVGFRMVVSYQKDQVINSNLALSAPPPSSGEGRRIRDRVNNQWRLHKSPWSLGFGEFPGWWARGWYTPAPQGKKLLCLGPFQGSPFGLLPLAVHW